MIVTILALALAATIAAGALAKHGKGRKRSMSGYYKGNVDESLGLGTLASNTLVSDTWDETVNEKSLLSSIVATWSLDQLTLSQGPISFGVAHSDYTDAEIEEVIENAGSWDRGNKIAREMARRQVRVIGVFEGLGETVQDVNFNDGRPIKTKLNWVLQTGDTLKMWAYNDSATALSTTAPTMKSKGHANLWSI